MPVPRSRLQLSALPCLRDTRVERLRLPTAPMPEHCASASVISQSECTCAGAPGGLARVNPYRTCARATDVLSWLCPDRKVLLAFAQAFARARQALHAWATGRAGGKVSGRVRWAEGHERRQVGDVSGGAPRGRWAGRALPGADAAAGACAGATVREHARGCHSTTWLAFFSVPPHPMRPRRSCSTSATRRGPRKP